MNRVTIRATKNQWEHISKSNSQKLFTWSGLMHNGCYDCNPLGEIIFYMNNMELTGFQSWGDVQHETPWASIQVEENRDVEYEDFIHRLNSIGLNTGELVAKLEKERRAELEKFSNGH